MDHSQLITRCAQLSAIRLVGRLQPAGGPGAFVAPPSMPDGVKLEHIRRVDGADVKCTLIATVAAMANQFETALTALRREGLPLVVCVIDEAIGDYRLRSSTLDMPHRGADALARSCWVGETEYMKSDLGRALLCTIDDVRPLARWHQSMLILGGWHSHGGQQGIRLARPVAAELVAINSRPTPTPGGRWDMTPASKDVVVYPSKVDDPLPFTLEKKDSRKLKTNEKTTPSARGLGMIPPGSESKNTQNNQRGVTADYYDLTAVLSLPALRRLGTGDLDPAPLHVALAACTLAAVLRAIRDGIWIRSRCHLIPDGPPCLEAVGPDGAVEPLELTADEARKFALACIEKCRAGGVEWGDETVVLTPSDRLRELISKSLALGVEE